MGRHVLGGRVRITAEFDVLLQAWLSQRQGLHQRRQALQSFEGVRNASDPHPLRSDYPSRSRLCDEPAGDGAAHGRDSGGPAHTCTARASARSGRPAPAGCTRTGPRCRAGGLASSRSAPDSKPAAPRRSGGSREPWPGGYGTRAPTLAPLAACVIVGRATGDIPSRSPSRLRTRPCNCR